MNRLLWSTLLLGGVACVTDDPGIIISPQDTSNAGDHDAPVIEHDSIDTTQVYGQSVWLSATVTDEGEGVFVVQAFYRQETSSMWEDIVLVDMEGDGTYEGNIPGSDVLTGGMYYYLYAMDKAENETFEPDEGEDDPFHFRISPGDG
jgi:hypothetical protein